MAFLRSLFGAAASGVGTIAKAGIGGAYYVARGTSRVVGRNAEPAMRAAFAVAAPVTKAGIVAGGGIATWALRNPEMALLAGVGGLGMYANIKMGAQERSMSKQETLALAERTGTSTGFEVGTGSMARDPNRMAFIDSTVGLTQGLHRGRHG